MPAIAPSKAIAAVLVLGAGSVLAYNWATTGCPSGVCPTTRSGSVTPVAGAAADASDSDAIALPSCCAELGYAACGDASACADMGAIEHTGDDAPTQHGHGLTDALEADTPTTAAPTTDGDKNEAHTTDAPGSDTP